MTLPSVVSFPLLGYDDPVTRGGSTKQRSMLLNAQLPRHGLIPTSFSTFVSSLFKCSALTHSRLCPLFFLTTRLRLAGALRFLFPADTASFRSSHWSQKATRTIPARIGGFRAQQVC